MINEIINTLSSAPVETVEEYKKTAKTALMKGWYLNDVSIFHLGGKELLPEQLEVKLLELFKEDWEGYWEIIFNVVNPNRKEILEEAKKCHENGLYTASIHLFFSQSDGIFSDKFNSSLYRFKGDISKEKLDNEITAILNKESVHSLFQHYKDGDVFERMFNEVYIELSQLSNDMLNHASTMNDDNNKIPNRHGVLHGVHTKYSSEINSYKVFSLLYFIVNAIYRDEIRS